MSAEYNAFNETQNGIYDKFYANEDQVPTKGLQVDPGTEVQSGYLIAWRFPEAQASEIADHSIAMSDVVPSVLYGYNDDRALDNAHVTLSDLDVVKGRVLDVKDEATQATLQDLSEAVQAGIDNVGGLVLPHDALRFEDGVVHNGKTAIMPGQSHETVFNVRQSVIQAAGGLGIQLKGAWGAHSTTSRVLHEVAPEDAAINPFLAVVDQAPILGAVRPSSLDVGYFNASPEEGFVFQPFQSFEVSSGQQL